MYSKRALSILPAVLLCLSPLPTGALADQEPEAEIEAFAEAAAGQQLKQAQRSRYLILDRTVGRATIFPALMN